MEPFFLKFVPLKTFEIKRMTDCGIQAHEL